MSARASVVERGGAAPSWVPAANLAEFKFSISGYRCLVVLAGGEFGVYQLDHDPDTDEVRLAQWTALVIEAGES